MLILVGGGGGKARGGGGGQSKAEILLAGMMIRKYKGGGELPPSRNSQHGCWLQFGWNVDVGQHLHVAYLLFLTRRCSVSTSNCASRPLQNVQLAR